MEKSKKNPRVSVGVPVYNGADTIQECLNSIVSQTFDDFEIIISDNASTDGTQEICREYLDKEPRIRYFRQEKNMGQHWNFKFVLRQARGEYFTWLAIDDRFHQDFLEKNVNVLNFNKNFVASVGMAKNFIVDDPFKKERNFLRKIGLSFRPVKYQPVIGTYEQRVKTYLKTFSWYLICCVFRTKELQNSMIPDEFVSYSAGFILNILRYGEINVINEVLLYIYQRGISSKGIIYQSKLFNKSAIGIIFPHYNLTVWCAKNLGIRLFLENLLSIIRLNLDAEFLFLVDIIHKIKGINKSKEHS